MPTEHPERVELGVGEILVVSMNVQFLAAIEDVLIHFQSFINRQKFLLHNGVIALSVCQFAGVKGHRLVILHDSHCAKLIVTVIGIDVKGFVQVWISQDHFLGKKRLHLFECKVTFLGPVKFSMFRTSGNSFQWSKYVRTMGEHVAIGCNSTQKGT